MIPTDLEELRATLPPTSVLLDPDAMAGYRWDRANDPSSGVPAAVVRATCTEDVQTTVRFAAAHHLALVTRGAGTGLSGGATAVEGSIVLSTERMRAVTIQPERRTAVAGPGALTGDVKASAAEHGLWYPPDPASFEISSIGGNVATNAGGLCCVKYGVTTDYVLGMTVVLADGRAVRLGGERLKDSAGLSLTKLFVGSEGTLGVITEVVLRLVPAQRPRATAVATFASLDAAAAAVVEISTRARPAMLEFMDGAAVNAVEDMTRMGLDRGAAALLVVQCDEPEGAQTDLEVITSACEGLGATEVHATRDPEDGEAFVRARRLALPAIERRGSVLLEDVCVPLPRLAALATGIAALAQRHQVDIPVVAHAGDGNAHPVIVYDATDAAAVSRAHEAFAAVMQLALELDGTITGEHGVGRLKAPWLGSYLGDDALELNRRIKQALDPQGILNPGCMF